MKKYSRETIVATFLIGVILGHLSAPTQASAHNTGNNGAENISAHLHNINDTLVKIERKIK